MDATLAIAGKPCELGTDPTRYLDIFDDWYEHANLLVNSLGVKDDTQKLNLLLLWGGRDLRKLANVRDRPILCTRCVYSAIV